MMNWKWMVFAAAAVSCTERPAVAPGVVAGDASKGAAAARTSCITCHTAEDAEQPVAPTWAEMQAAYADDPAALAAYIAAPGAREPRLEAAVKRFGPMPDMGVSAAGARDLAAFILQTKFNSPSWAHASPAEVEPVSPLERATNLARATKGVLGKNLMAALKVGGTGHAVPFCNERAIPLTDSLSKALGAEIRRVSDRPRNPSNRAEGMAAAYLVEGHQKIAAGEPVEPVLYEIDGRHTAFVPILTNDMCLQCHGPIGGSLTDDTHRLILDRYPDDEATGYAANELRGAWVVEFDAP